MSFDRKQNRRIYYLKNREKELSQAKKRYLLNREISNEKHKVWMEKNREWTNEYWRTRYKQDLNYKIKVTLRARYNKAVKRGSKKGSGVKLLGCTIEELRRYLESKFLPGMSWSNWNYRGWHIDHIKPIDSFDFTDTEQQKLAMHYTNLQPLWGNDNLKKGSKLHG